MYRWITARIERADLGPVELNNHAYLLALARGVERAQLELARDRMAELPPANEDMHGLIDTLASLHFRLGDLTQAIAAERWALASSPEPAYAAKLAGFELAYARDAGPYRVGTHSDFELGLHLVDGQLDMGRTATN